jgi:hypothetical protein
MVERGRAFSTSRSRIFLEHLAAAHFHREAQVLAEVRRWQAGPILAASSAVSFASASVS